MNRSENLLMTVKSKAGGPIEVALWSGSGLFIERIRNILSEVVWARIVYESSNAKAIEKCLVQLRPDCLLLDSGTINISFIKLLNLITEKSPDTRVIIFSSDENWRRISQFQSKVNSSNIICLAKETGSSEVIQIIKNSKNHISARQTKRKDNKSHKLTKRELTVAGLVTDGFKNKEIAKMLSIKEGTVKSHLTDIFMKLGLQSRYQLIVFGRELRSPAEQMHYRLLTHVNCLK
jgi:DNA-binding NarL/FixJ family response regulator